MKRKVYNGIDRPEAMDRLLLGARLGVVTAGNAVDRDMRPAVDALCERYRVTALFNTILGIRGEYTLGERVPEYTDGPTGLPVYSIFSRGCVAPTEAMTRDVDVLVFDIKEAGVRYYEYLACAANVMKACAALGKPLVVLDRAAPIGGLQVEGTVCPPAMHTIVGDYALATRTALTLGEFCQYVNGEYAVGCDLHVVTAEGWSRDLYYDDTDLPWVLPSPSLPTVDANILYVGMCLFEGISTVSEGRGTTLPFSLIGAPWMDAREVVARLRGRGLDGARFGETYFKPSYGVHAGTLCRAVQVSIADRQSFDSFHTALALLDTLQALHGEHIAYRDCSAGHDVLEGESEPVFTRYIDKLLATTDYTDGVLDGDALVAKYAPDRAAYRERKAKYHLYG